MGNQTAVEPYFAWPSVSKKLWCEKVPGIIKGKTRT